MRRNKETELIKIAHGNFEWEHICCAISNGKDIQVMAKKAQLRERLDEGLILLKCSVRGRCFIEYTPTEYAWVSIETDGYMYISCLWVSEQLKGLDYSTLLLDEYIRDSKERDKEGSAILSSKKEIGYLSDPEYLEYRGFETADTTGPYFELTYLAFDRNANRPCFGHTAKSREDVPKSPVPYYTSQYPFTAEYVPLLEKTVKERNVELQTMHIQIREDAQDAPTPFTTSLLFCDGELLTHEILSEERFDRLIS